MNEGTSEARQCRICGYPLDRKNRTGLCSNKTPACRKAREQLAAEEKPGKFRIAIRAGDTFGLWTVLEDYDRASLSVSCRCACGTERQIGGSELTNGRTRACRSCAPKNRQRPAREPYLKAGSTFARLTLLEDAAYAHDRPRWRCECGIKAEIEIDASSVKFGHTKSCGCLHREANTVHGLSKHPLYMIWKGVVLRCTVADHAAYPNYGGRGISVCDRWLNDVRAFIADVEREIGPRPEGVGEGGRALYSLDRWPDNDGNYEPGNLRWGTAEEQVANQRKVPVLTRDLLRVTKERDALAAELAALKATLAPRKLRVPALAEEPLF